LIVVKKIVQHNSPFLIYINMITAIIVWLIVIEMSCKNNHIDGTYVWETTDVLTKHIYDSGYGINPRL